MADITTEELEELENEVVSKDDNIKTMQEFVSPESLYQELIASVKKYHPSTDISLIEKAYKTADTAHKGQDTVMSDHRIREKRLKEYALFHGKREHEGGS